MKRALGLLLFLAASALYGQTPSTLTPIYLTLQPFSGGIETGSSGGGYGTIMEEASALTQREILTFLGSAITCVDNAGALATECTVTGGGGAVASDTIWDAAGDLAIGTGADTAARLAIGAEGTVLGSNGTTAAWVGAGTGGTAGPCVPSRTVSCFFEDLYQRGVVTGGATFAPVGNMTGAGSATAGFVATGDADELNALNGDHPGVATLSTGTSTSSAYSLWGGQGGPVANSMETVSIDGGEIFEAQIWVPVISSDANAHKIWIGFGDIYTSADPTDGLYLYWNGQTTGGSPFIGCGAASASGGADTNTLSNLTFTAAAWHTLRIEVNSNATSVAYIVDGTPLSCSPLTTDIPVAATELTAVQLKIGAMGAGCAAISTCTLMVDYVYFYDPSIGR